MQAMENVSKALLVIAILGLVSGAAGYAGFATGEPAGDFMHGALPGIMIGLCPPPDRPSQDGPVSLQASRISEQMLPSAAPMKRSFPA